MPNYEKLYKIISSSAKDVISRNEHNIIQYIEVYIYKNKYGNI